MTDRDLLELAAKALLAAGMEKFNHIDYSGWAVFDDEGYARGWNPLQDDGDALRLAVKLRLVVDIDDEAGEAWVRKPWYADCEVAEPFGDDPFAATRRAITRAAAEIGKAMP